MSNTSVCPVVITRKNPTKYDDRYPQPSVPTKVKGNADYWFNQWLWALANGGYMKCCGTFKNILHNESGDKLFEKYCGVGVLWNEVNIRRRLQGKKQLPDNDGAALSEYTGIPESVFVDIYDLNDDSPMCFKQMAAWLKKHRAEYGF